MRPLACFAVAAIIVTAQTGPGAGLSFTRPTLVAVPTNEPTVIHRRIFDDDAYAFVSRHYGSGPVNTTPGLFAFGKRQRAWIQILELSTEHARFGHSPDLRDVLLSVSWNYGPLIARDFARVPLRTGGSISLPDRIVRSDARRAYRLDFDTDMQREEMVTWFWVSDTDLEAAFEDARRPKVEVVRASEGTRVAMDGSTIAVVGVSVNSGEQLAWSLDTASPSTIVDSQFAHIAKLTPSAPEYPRDAANRTVVDRVHGVTLNVGGVILPDQRVDVAWINTRENRGVGGILGAPFFERFTVAIDFDAKALQLIDPANFTYGGQGESIPIELVDGTPVVRAAIVIGSTRSEARLRVHTGTSTTIVLNRSFAAARKLAISPVASPLLGPNDYVRYAAGHADSLIVGRFALTRFPIHVVDDPPSREAGTPWDGSIGNGVLRRFRAIVDRQRKRLILEPGELFDAPYDYDLSGVTVVANGRRLGIGSITGPLGASSGLQAGDWILAVDGRNASELTLSALRQMFARDGRTRRVMVERYGIVRNIAVTMKRADE